MVKHLYFSDCCVTIIILFYNVLTVLNETHIHFVSHIPSSSLLTANHQSAFGLCGFTHKYFVQMDSYTMWPLTSGFLQWQCFKLPCHGVHQLCHCFVAESHPTAQNYLSLLIHPSLMDTWAISLFWQLSFVCAFFFLNITSQCLGVYTQKWNSWALQSFYV